MAEISDLDKAVDILSHVTAMAKLAKKIDQVKTKEERNSIHREMLTIAKTMAADLKTLGFESESKDVENLANELEATIKGYDEAKQE